MALEQAKSLYVWGHVMETAGALLCCAALSEP